MINQEVLKGRWREFKGALQKKWGDLTDDELDKVKGDWNAVSGLIQQKYGLAKKAVGEKLNELMENLKSRSESESESEEQTKH